MRVRLETYDEFKSKATGSEVYFTWDPKAGSEESPLFFARAMVKGVTLEFWCETKPATFDVDFPAAVPGTMEE